ncbi:histone-lysine N-methyltransferase SETD2 [Caerostris darwini]|uniref:[histone H3]-lysine(36) N-trimethyltransferase n=1 Tax=Caerostris darwini TaxID=1538125 RepID=A0AAV4UMF0_9ARAC|nr:histone-lysine N-methyltransferase SETD2 [Caerostris darwini]
MSKTEMLIEEIKHSMPLNEACSPMNVVDDMDSDEIIMPLGVREIVSEMVEIISKVGSEKFFYNDNSKQESSSDNKDLPIRRSSRIKRLSVKLDSFDKKGNTKKSKTTKDSESKSKDENFALNNEEMSPQNDNISSKSYDQVTNVKSETLSDSNISNMSDETKNQKGNKRVKKRQLSKSEKEKKDNSKNDKKKTSTRRKKQMTDAVENSINEVIDDVVNSSLTCENSELMPENISVTSSSLIPCSVVVDNMNYANPVPDTVSDSTKQEDIQSHECKDKFSENSNLKPVKVKSRWWRSSELEGVLNTESTIPVVESAEFTTDSEISVTELATQTPINESKKETEDQNGSIQKETYKELSSDIISTKEKPDYEHIDENIYRFAKKKSKIKKQVRRMVCDCTLTKEEIEYGMLGCKAECLNRLLMIECGSRCPLGDACSNKRFQKKQNMKAEIIKTEKKGWGLRALEDISADDFILEFVGEVLNHKEYRQRVKLYAKEKNVHSYFMALKTDEILDATYKGNWSRFINHSCDPNCETQKWTVNGELRVGVFAKRRISAGEEFTLDYQFQRYGREAQKCFCGADICSGYIGNGKQISIDAYSSAKSGPTKRKKGVDDKKRELEDMALEEEIEKLNSNVGLRNREETLKLARLMVRADENNTRHQLLDIIIKTEEQACLRLFLDYHGLPLLWSWMTDTVELDLKAKILQVLTLLPVSNKTMLLDSKVMSVVEKWVEEFSNKPMETNKPSEQQSDENPQPLIKKFKNIEFSDSETDSSGSHNTNDNISENSSVAIENNFKEMLTSEISSSEPLIENKSPNDSQDTKVEIKKDDPNLNLKTSIFTKGAELLNNWKNLKEVFRIPRLEQQKRKEDELEADHNIHVCAKTEEKKPEVEFTGDQIQVLISGKTPSFSDNLRIFEYENPDVNYKMDDRSRNNNKMKKRAFIPKMQMEDLSQRKPKEDSDSPLDGASPSISSSSPVMQSSNRPALLPTPNFVNQPPVSFPPPINTGAPLPHLEQTPPAIYPPPIVYPPSQIQFVNTAAPPPLLTHPPTSMPPPSVVIPQAVPLLPPNVNIPPCQSVNTGLPPIPSAFQLPPSSAVVNYPPGPGTYNTQNQPPYYFMQHPPAVPNSVSPATFTETVAAPVTPMHVQPANPLQIQQSSIPVQSSAPLSIQPASSLPMQVPVLSVQPTTSLTVQAGTPLSVPVATVSSTDTTPVQAASPIIIEKSKPVKLPKLWRSAKDSEGNVITQWDPPDMDEAENESEDENDDSESEESESSDTPTYDEPKNFDKHSKRKSKKKKTTKVGADTTVNSNVRPEVAKKIKELFRTKMSSYIVHCLNAYRKSECKLGRITNNEDFKYLARKLTHYTMTKELKQCKNVEDLECNECVMHKAKDFIKKYMSKYGTIYSRKEKFSPPEA